MTGGTKKLPEKWQRYKNHGTQVKNSRFVPFKAPLDESYFAGKSLPVGQQLTVRRLVHELRHANLNVGLVIDLTTSFKYYNPSEWGKFGIEYAKLKCDAQSLMQKREDFFSVVNGYLAREKNKLIGVHCAHGLNRTGFLICSYMVEQLGIPIKEAIEDFETARGHKIETSLGKLEELKAHLDSSSINGHSSEFTDNVP